MKNPCRDCPHLPEDKNGPTCRDCADRVAYVRSLGSLVDMQPFINGSGTGGIKPSVGGGYDAGEDTRYKTCRGPACLRINPEGVERPINEFTLSQHGKDGYASTCKKCEAFRYQKRKLDSGLKACRNDQKEKTMEKQAEFKSTKTCTGGVCLAINPAGVEKPVSEFGPDGKSKDGLKGHCRRCNAWSVKKSALKKQGVSDPKPQDYGYTLEKPPGGKPTPNRYKKGPKKSAGIPAPSPVIPAKAGNQDKTRGASILSPAKEELQKAKFTEFKKRLILMDPTGFPMTAALWSTYLANRAGASQPLTEQDVVIMMDIYKVVKNTASGGAGDDV